LAYFGLVVHRLTYDQPKTKLAKNIFLYHNPTGLHKSFVLKGNLHLSRGLVKHSFQ
jgi:hypothetical protein